MICEEQEYAGIKYCLFKPENFSADHRYPVIFFTHGAGTRGDDLNMIKNHSVVKKLIVFADNCVIFAPQCATNTWFDVFESLISLVKHAYSQPYVDKNRFYGSGASMGGYCMYQLMQSVPEVFAAGIICCGGGMYWNAARLSGVALRIFHGAKDEVVYPEESKRMYEEIKKCGGDVTLTVYPECDHDCWSKTYSDPDNYEWLLSKEKKI
ncbi:MAG: prolyl oligopeptidase family serine peptidase [Candidatus Neoclostridium sp.]